MNDIEKMQLVDRIANVFGDMDLIGRYQFLKDLGFPEYILQTVEIDKVKMIENAQSLVDCVLDNGPEYVNLLKRI
jgi:hypothetical protein